MVTLTTQTSIYIASYLSILSKHIWILLGISLLSLVNGQEELYKHTKLCSNGSKHGFIDGIFEYEYWDSIANAPVYKRIDVDIYLYPIIWGSIRAWHIHYNPDDSFSYGRCQINGIEFKLDDCMNGWQYATTNGIFVEDIDMRLVNCTDICVKGNERPRMDGVYIWQYFNKTVNGSVYYCKECDYGESTYLFPFILTTNETNFSVWAIASDLSLSGFWSVCAVGQELEAEYVFNLNDCVVSWFSKNIETDQIEADVNLTVEVCTESPTITTTTAAPIRTEIEIGTILWFIIAILVIIDIIIVAFCIYYIHNKLLQRVKEPYNAPWFTAIKQFGFFHFLGICMEIYDIGTDYVFSVDLILSPEPRDLTKVSLGWAALVISAVGLILFICKYMAIRKLVGKQIAKYRYQLKTTKNEEKRLEIMEKIRIRIMDIDVLSLFNGCIEDVPTSIIVLIVFTNYGFSKTSILCITGNVVSFGLKVSTIIMGKYGCKDVTDEYDPNIQPLENEKEEDKQNIVTIEGETDDDFTHSTHGLLAMELQESAKI